MALKSQIHIGWQNDLAAVIPTSTPAPVSSHPIANMLSPVKGRPTRWSVSSPTTITLRGSSPDQRTATALMLKGHNGGADTKVRWRLYEGESQATLAWDSTDRAIPVYVPWNEHIAGIDPLGSYYVPGGNLDPVFFVCAPGHVRWRSYRIDITMPSAAGNIFQVDQMAMFFAWPPEHNFEYGSRFWVEDASEHFRTGAGGMRTTQFPARRRMNINFAYQRDNYRNVLMHILAERAKKGGPLYVIANPNDAGYTKVLQSSIYVRAEDAGYEGAFYNGSNTSLALIEN